MNNKEHIINDCTCEHHSNSQNLTHHKDGKCSKSSFVDTLIDFLKKEFENDSEEK